MNDIRDPFQNNTYHNFTNQRDEPSSIYQIFQSFLDVNNIYIILKDDIPDKQTHAENRQWQNKGAVAL